MSKKEKIIMGVDPGTNILGYSIIQVGAKKPRLIDMGVISMQKLKEHTEKLKAIFEGIQRLISLYSPVEFAVEAPFYGKDVQAMLKLGRAQGVAMAAAIMRGLPITEYSPRSIKKSVTGNGNASKEQVAAMLPHLVEGEVFAKYLDATDALAVALCHHTQSSGPLAGAKRYNDWSAFIKNNPNRKL